MKKRHEEQVEDLPAGVELGGKDDKDFHADDEGAWWYRTYDVSRMSAADASQEEMMDCATSIPGVQWVPASDPSPDNAISPEVLAGMAFRQMKLPGPTVKLSPPSGKQTVNLETYVKFSDSLQRVWVTAEFHDFGIDIAATTVATPKELRVNAGTEFADPQSCTYDLTKAEEGYQVNSEGASCNVTYRKSSGDGTYAFEAQITWGVKWTATDSPDGPAEPSDLPDGLSTTEEQVTVGEIQSIVR